MVKAIGSGGKWKQQIPQFILDELESRGKDYSLQDVIDICEEIIELYNPEYLSVTWKNHRVADLMMTTVTYRNKYKRYLK